MKRLVICAAARFGGYLGYEWQFAPKWLVGLEGDFAWGNESNAWGNESKRVEILKGVAPPAPNNLGNFSEVKQTWDAGLRARLGYLIDPTWLLYVTGGEAFLQTNGTTRTGWTIGAGIEEMLPGKWLIRGEYRYADFGT
jgi:outer membrane immunogenic protein